MLPGKHRVQRIALNLPFSREGQRYSTVRIDLILYRIAFGQVRQEDLMAQTTYVGKSATAPDFSVFRGPQFIQQPAPHRAKNTVPQLCGIDRQTLCGGRVVFDINARRDANDHPPNLKNHRRTVS